MSIFFEIIIAISIIGVVLALLYIARGALFTPVPRAVGTNLYTVVAVCGDASQLEQTVDGLLWLEKSGTMRSLVLITDCGLSAEGRKIAALLTKDNRHVVVCNPSEITDFIEVPNG